MRSTLLVVVALLAVSNDVDGFLTAKQEGSVIAKDFQSRAGETDVPYSKYPFMAFLPGTGDRCYILSNYTCAAVKPPLPQQVWSNFQLYTTANDSMNIQSGTLHPVENYNTHPKFNGTKLEYWISIITVSVPFSTPVVTLPPANAVLSVGTVVTAVGLSYDQSLFEYDVKVVDDSLCASDPYFGSLFVPGATICTQDVDVATSVVTAIFYNGAMYGQTQFSNGNISLVQPFSNAVPWLRGC